MNERTIRPMAPNRKNALFAVPGFGVTKWAASASLTETLHLNAS